MILLSGWLVAAGVMALALTFVARGGPLQAEAREREAVRVTATALAQHLTTFEGAEIDDWVAATQAQVVAAVRAWPAAPRRPAAPSGRLAAVGGR